MVSWCRRQLQRLDNMPVMGSRSKWTVPPWVGLTILLWVNQEVTENQVHQWIRQTFTDNGKVKAKEEEINGEIKVH